MKTDKTIIKIGAGLALAAALAGAASQKASAYDGTPGVGPCGEPVKVDVCHRTYGAHPYQLLTVNIHSVQDADSVGGHYNHATFPWAWGSDAWEAYDYCGVHYPGHNPEFVANGCELPATATPTYVPATPTPTETQEITDTVTPGVTPTGTIEETVSPSNTPIVPGEITPQPSSGGAGGVASSPWGYVGAAGGLAAIAGGAYALNKRKEL